MTGKRIRIQKICKTSSPIIILPLDHALSNGVIAGIENPLKLMEMIDSTLLNSIVINKGWALKNNSSDILSKYSFFIHLSASASLLGSDRKVLTTSVKEAISLGADGVSIHINFNSDSDSFILGEIGGVIRKSNEYGLPVLAMLYKKEMSGNDLLHMAKLAEELGVDFIKVPYFHDEKILKKLFLTIDTPIFMAGGEFEDDYLCFLEKTKYAVSLGAKGIIAGRNIFQRVDPSYCLYLLRQVICGNIQLSEIENTDKRLRIKK